MYGNVNVLKGGSNFYESAKKIYLDSSTAILKASLNATDIDKGQYYFDRLNLRGQSLCPSQEFRKTESCS